VPPFRISQLVPANASGTFTFSFNIPASLSGIEYHFQAVQISSCLVSDVVSTQF
jgi:hypothetical protein